MTMRTQVAMAAWVWAMGLVWVAWGTGQAGASVVDMPCPFTRVLSLTNPPLSGIDVLILQRLLMRSVWVTVDLRPCNGTFDGLTAFAVQCYQAGTRLPATGVVDNVTAQQLLLWHTADNYRDDGRILPGYLYKVHIAVHSNRSIETLARLFDNQMNLLLTFQVRTHGQGSSQLCGSGDTPTGLMTFDLNSPEDDPKSFGPFPVNRAVLGLSGNAEFLLPYARNGILMHTGEWEGWAPPQPMPDSHGCVHAWPDAIENVWHILVDKLGVEVRNNTFGQLPYPYVPQGLLSVEQFD